MANGIFIIQELPVDGSPGERFEWTADRTPAAGSTGGARACPIQPWPLGGKLRTVRTDYPGSRRPSEQILGANHKPFKLSGKWDDRYNRVGDFVNGGYARAEMRRFEAMCHRGNPCRFQYLSIVRDGYIIDWDFPYRREWMIGYEFEVSVHDDPSAPKDLDRSPATVYNPSTQFDRFDAAVQALLDAHDAMPAPQMAGTLATDTTANLSTLTATREQLGATLDARELIPPENPVDAFTRLATQFRTARSNAYDAVVALATVRADLDMAVSTAMSVLDFEDWSRSVRFMARIAIGEAYAGDIASTQRSSPDAKRLYRPTAGESLYAISRKFYGTPHGWRLIYERNNLSTWTLDGTEVLIIPERGS